jgi:hypothetical protein
VQRLSLQMASHDSSPCHTTCLGAGAVPSSIAAGDCATDEEFARLLAKQLAEEDASGASQANAPNPDDEWVTVSAKKAAAPSSTQAPPPSSSSSTSSSSASSLAAATASTSDGVTSTADDEATAAQESAVSAAKSVNATLAQQWGNWFTFNDSNVSAMGVTGLQKAFKGAAPACRAPRSCDHGMFAGCLFRL